MESKRPKKSSPDFLGEIKRNSLSKELIQKVLHVYLQPSTNKYF